METNQQQTPPTSTNYRFKQLYLQNLPEAMTPEKLAQLLTSQNLSFNDCKVNLNEETKLNQSGNGYVSFNTKTECKTEFSVD